VVSFAQTPKNIAKQQYKLRFVYIQWHGRSGMIDVAAESRRNILNGRRKKIKA
jgi:hypothetical protein